MPAIHPMSADFALVARRAAHPPIHEVRFWVIQLMVLTVAVLHLLVDVQLMVATSAFPAGVPVTLLIVPVGYAALRYGLAGSAATGIWAVFLWLPDLLLPPKQGHIGGDLVDLMLILVVTLFFGQRIDYERLAFARGERATAEALAVETRYHRLFETNRAPIMVLNSQGMVADANPAARLLFGPDVVGKPGASIAEIDPSQPPGRVLALSDGRDYRIDLVAVPSATGERSTQMIFEDVTEERSEGRRATHYAALVVQAEEDQRRHLARELHDEPLQLFLHLARRIESLGGAPGVPADVAAGLVEVRDQVLDAAAGLRSLARDLRPPTLDRLGLVAALTSLIADLEDDAGLHVRFQTTGADSRVAPELELGAFRLIQEALRNIVRHAETDTCTVSVEFHPDELRLRVDDAGLGFDPESGDQPGSGQLGLLGMRERTRLLGGALLIKSSPGQGTVVEATLPLVRPLTVPETNVAASARHSPSHPDGLASVRESWTGPDPSI
jgi:Signal transduction histidine kinase